MTKLTLFGQIIKKLDINNYFNKKESIKINELIA